MYMSNDMIRTMSAPKARRSLGAAVAVAALGLGLAGCGSQAEQPNASASQTANSATASPSSESASPTASAEGTQNTGAENVPGSADDVYAALATATGSAAGLKAYEYDYENTLHEVKVADAQKGQKITLSTDGKTVQKTESENVDKDDLQALPTVKVDMKQAMETALKEAPGVPDSADLEEDNKVDGKDRPAWRVRVVGADAGETEVLVDAADGSVLENV